MINEIIYYGINGATKNYDLEIFLSDHAFIGPGWKPLLHELFEKLFSLGWNGHLLQLHEKYGLLDIVIGLSTNEMLNCIFETIQKSGQTCENCGKPAVLNTTAWWRKTACNECQTSEINQFPNPFFDELGQFRNRRK